MVFNIADIRPTDFPMFFVKGATSNQRFTITPFSTRLAAEKHIGEVILESGDWAEDFIIEEYTVDMWRKDLIDEIMRDKECMERALSILRSETLANILKD